MKRLLILMLMLITTSAFAVAPARIYNYTAGAIIQPAEVTANEDALFSYLVRGVDTYGALSITTAALASECVTSDKIDDGTIVNADISGSAGIVYSKLTLTGSVVGADLSSSIAITTSGAFSSTNTVATTSTTTTSGLYVTGSLKDKDGNYGLSGQVLTVTGNGLIDWGAATNTGYTQIAWATIKADGSGVDDSYNVTNITDNGAGDYTVNWSITFANDDYCVLVSGKQAGGGGFDVNAVTTTTTRVKAYAETAGTMGLTDGITYVEAKGD